MRNLKISIITLSLFFIIISLNALNIQSNVDITKVGLNETFTLTVEVSGDKATDVRDINLQDKFDFDILGQTSSSSSSITIVNGKMEQKTTKSFIYTLQPHRIGTFLIPPISLNFNGKTISTTPIKITEVKNTGRTSNKSNRHQNNFFPDPFSYNQSQRKSSKNNTFIVAELDKKTVFVGEPVIVSYYILTRDRLQNLSFGNTPDYKGFWKENLFTADKVRFSKFQYNGQIFNRMLLTKISLTSNEPGKFFIPSLEMNVQISVPARSFFDFDSSRQIIVRSKKI